LDRIVPIPDSKPFNPSRTALDYRSNSKNWCCNPNASLPNKSIDMSFSTCRYPLPLVRSSNWNNTYGRHVFVIRGRAGAGVVQDFFASVMAYAPTTYIRYWIMEQEQEYELRNDRPFEYYGNVSQINFTQCSFIRGHMTEAEWGVMLTVQWYDSRGTGPEYVLDFGNGASGLGATASVLGYALAVTALILFCTGLL
jgi:hypothetical protein